MQSSKDEAAGSDEQQPLDLKPLLSLAPMFPTPPGYDLIATQPPDPPFVYVRPRCSTSSAERSITPAPASAARPSAPVSSVPLKVTPISAAAPLARPPAPVSSAPLKVTPISAAAPVARPAPPVSSVPLKVTPISAAAPLARPPAPVSSAPLKVTPISAAAPLARPPAPVSSAPLMVTPISAAFPTPATRRHSVDGSSDQDYRSFREKKRKPAAAPAAVKRLQTATTKRARQGGDGDGDGDGDSKVASIKRRRPTRRSIDKELLFTVAGGWPTPSATTNPREGVGAAMAMFDSFRRRMLQLDEKGGPGASKRADLKASALMMRSNLRINTLKTIGPVPGVDIGDIFFFRIEMCVVGLHAPPMAGIDYISARHVREEDEILAVSIISAGGYENDDGDTDTLVYTGQGGISRNKEKHDQKLERGNLALMNSSKKKNQIRVVRGVPDPLCNLAGKVYVYDGIYRIEDSWMDTAKNGFNVFKYRLRRDPGQPDGISVWKMTAKWRANRGTREKVILPDLSSKVENIPVCLVNDVDDEKGPSHFDYVTGVKYCRPLSRNEPLQGCKCGNVCLPGDSNCLCGQRNGGDLPYSASGVLVKRVRMLYECSSNCHCSQNCRNRVAQKGVRLNFEVFWTGHRRGWGLRSSDPIRAGTFICEYAGEVIDETKPINTEDDSEEDDYIFETSCPNDKVLKWNMGAELLEQKSSGSTTTHHTFEQHLPIIITAKDAGNVARFLNHSCSPNLLWQAVQYDHGDDAYPHIAFFAMQHIPPMTELTYDYGVRGAPPGIKGKFPGSCNKLKRCLCGSTNCRGSF